MCAGIEGRPGIIHDGHIGSNRRGCAQPAMTWQARLRRYLKRRGRQLLRGLIGLIVGLLIAAALLEIYRGASLLGLPDVGDPFDVAAFRATRIPAEQDAYIPLREAQTKTSRMPIIPATVRTAGPTPWSKRAPELREWLSKNLEALEKFREASELPDGLPNPNFDQVGNYAFYLNEVIHLPLLEAAHLEERGDMAGAGAGIGRCYASGCS